MKNKLYVGVLLAMSSPIVFAQSSVTLYGVADVGLEFLTHANAAGNSLSRVTTGNISASRWGLRGVEDLGSGNKAVYVLESGFDIDTGLLNQGGRLFGRQAYVGLQNQWGTVTLGRQQNALLDVVINYDPLALSARYSSLMMDANLAGRYDNTVKYTGTFGPVNAIALYSFARGTTITSGGVSSFGSETAGDMKSDTAFGGALEYSSGPVAVTLAYDEQRGTRGIAGQNSGQNNRSILAAGTYNFGNSTILAGYRWFNGDIGNAPGTPGRRNDVYWLGYRLQATSAFRVTAAGYYFDDKRSGRDPWSLVLTGSYAFSKRTDANLSVGYVHNKENSNLGLNGFGSAIQPGANQTGVMANIRHKF